MSLPAASTAAGEVKQSKFKMASYIEITLLDAETNEAYKIVVNPEDAKRAESDLEFATQLLGRARSNSHLDPSVGDRTICDDSVFDNKENNYIKDKEQHIWTKQETLLLLEIYTLKEKEFHNGKNTVKQCWENISKEIKKHGHHISGQKCTIKFQAMKRTYKSIKDHNNKSGNNTRKWEYFDMMDQIFNTKPWVEPLSVAGTSVCAIQNDSAIPESSIKETSKQGIKRKVNVENYLEKLLEEKRLKREADDKRHREKIEQFEHIKDLLQNLIQK